MDMLQDPQYKSEDGSALRIWRDPAKNNFLSEKHGRPIFDDVLYVEVISPGSRDSTPVFECVRNFAPEMAHPEPLHGTKYEEFKKFIVDFENTQNNDASLAGTPLSEFKEMTRSMVASLKAQSIFTVDALAALPDSKLIVVGPDGRTWREKAIAYIESAKGGAYATAIAADLENTKLELNASRQQVAELAATVAALQATTSGQTTPAATPTPKPAKTPPAPAPAPLAPVETDLDPITGLPASTPALDPII